MVQLPAIHAVQRLPLYPIHNALGEAPKKHAEVESGEETTGRKSFGTFRKGEISQLPVVRLEETTVNIDNRSSIMVLWTAQ